jgi:predicted anti-sigma-YlaC factor YlaD
MAMADPTGNGIKDRATAANLDNGFHHESLSHERVRWLPWLKLSR